MTCRDCEMILSAQLEGEATASQWLEAEQHMITCRACARQWEEFQARTTLLKTQLVRREPSEALWGKISARIEAEPQPAFGERWREQWESWTRRSWLGVPRLAFGAGIAVVVFAFFSLSQWQKRTSTNFPQAQLADSTRMAALPPKIKPPRIELGENDPLLRARLAQNVADYFEATRLVLLEVKNNAEAPQEFDLAEVRASSQKLLEQSLLLKTEMHGEQLTLLRSTFEQLEVVLFDLANLEAQPEPEEMTALRVAIQQGDLLIKIEIIDLEALMRKAKEQPLTSKPRRRTMKPII